MSVIGIDPGTKCGWCVRHDGGGMDSGTWNLKGGRFFSVFPFCFSFCFSFFDLRSFIRSRVFFLCPAAPFVRMYKGFRDLARKIRK